MCIQYIYNIYIYIYRFEIPEDIHAKEEEIQKRINETRSLMEVTRSEIKSTLIHYTTFPENVTASQLSIEKWFIRKEKNLYHKLNQMKLEGSRFEGICWIPKNEEQEVHQCIERLSRAKNIIPPTLKEITLNHPLVPPTLFRTNDFIRPFQQIIDLYGIPKYKEGNPALFTIITFPFMFGVMFGDICHGSIILLIAAYLCIRKDYLERGNSILKGLVPNRYLFLMMGIFSTFCGFMYNDFASLPLNLFGSCYTNNLDGRVGVRTKECVYPFGIDPKWYVAKNQLYFLNSFKMKFAVIIGVIQMVIGVLIKGLNSVNRKNYVDLLFEFIPQILFLCGFFGFMVVMIFIKWSVDWASVDQKGPGIIDLLISIGLNLGVVGKTPLFGDGSLQRQINITILSILYIYIYIVITILTVPWMLYIKPFLLQSEFKNKIAEREKRGRSELVEIRRGNEEHRSGYMQFDNEREAEGEGESSENLPPVGKGHLSILDPPLPKFDMGEVCIVQFIHTIEFVLGTISNTASYLRLWALSLAHAELSRVIYIYIYIYIM